jgi:hypothetical protein
MCNDLNINNLKYKHLGKARVRSGKAAIVRE